MQTAKIIVTKNYNNAVVMEPSRRFLSLAARKRQDGPVLDAKTAW